LTTKTRAVLVIPLVDALLLSVFSGLGYLLGRTPGIPVGIGLPLGLRLVGLLVLSSGFALLIWIFRYRPPKDMLDPTHATFTATLAATLTDSGHSGLGRSSLPARTASSAIPSTRRQSFS
jgi:hypothetical protein